MSNSLLGLAEKHMTVKKSKQIRGKNILIGAVDIEISASAEIAQALQRDAVLPTDVDPIRMSQARLGFTSEDHSVTFLGDSGNVSFSAGANLRTGLGAYRKPEEVLQDIAVLEGDRDQSLPLDQFDLGEVPAKRFLAFYWGYDVQAAANGSIALSPGAAVDFGAQGSRKRAFSVIRAHAKNPQARRAVKDLFQSWRLPSQIASIDDLQPGTWILAEVGGAFKGNLGVNLGYDFNWIRSLEIEGAQVLEGDIGLKIQAGVSAAFGFEASGQYILVVGRESLDPDDKVVRVRLNRAGRKGWSFAFNANLDLTTNTGTLLPEQLDDFVAAVLGVHGLQTLQEIRRWTDPSARLSDLASEFLTDFAKNQLGEDFQGKFEEIRQEVIDWFEIWDELPGEVTSALWDAVRLDQNESKAFVERLQEFADPDQAGDALEKALADVSFFSTPFGKWFLSVVEDRALSIITNRPEAERVRKAADRALEILDGGFLQELKDFVDKKVGIGPVRKAVTDNDFDSLSEQLKKKLARFLGKTSLDSQGVTDIRTTVNELLKRGDDLYQAGVEALNSTFKFSFDYAYSKQVAKTGLLDICFDFSANPDLGPELEKAIKGDFTAVLPPPGQACPKGVSYNEASLTHHIQKQAHAKISLPFLTQETIHKTSSLAGFKLLAQDGNIYLFELDATDEIIRTGSRAQWESTLSVGLNLTVGGDSEIRRYDKEGSPATIDYRFTQAVENLRTGHLVQMAEPLARLYFPNEFAGSGAEDKPSVLEWAVALDKTVDNHEVPEDGRIGNAVVSLDVSLPGDVLLNWLEAPEDIGDPVYADLSRRIQAQLRRLIPDLYFHDPRNYAQWRSAYPLLVWATLPISTAIEISNGQIRLNTNKGLYWDWRESGETSELKQLISYPSTGARFAVAMDRAAWILSETPGLKKKAKQYRSDRDIERVLPYVTKQPGKQLLDSLLYTEATLISLAAEAGRDLAQFRASTATPPEAVRKLAEFGETITKTFNSKLKTLFNPKKPLGRQALRNLSLLVFAEISEAFSPGTEYRPTAALEITVLRPDAQFPPAGFPEETRIASNDVGLQQRVLEVGSTT